MSNEISHPEEQDSSKSGDSADTADVPLKAMNVETAMEESSKDSLHGTVWGGPNRPHGESLLDSARLQWQVGNWEALIKLGLPAIQQDPERAKLAALVAGAWQQLGNHAAVRRFVRLAMEWGCDKRFIAQVLIAGAYNTLGRAAALFRDKDRSLAFFCSSVSSMKGHASLSGQVRAENEMMRLGLARGDACTSPSNQPHGTIDTAGGTVKEEISNILKNFKSEVKAELAIGRANPYVHNRTMTPELNKALRDFFQANMGKNGLRVTYIDYLAAKAIQIERNCSGRLATTVQDAVARQLVAESVPGNHLCVLEIGALYGINLAILYNHCVTRFEKIELLCLDPFDGFYGQAIDVVLNSPVNDLTFMRNMQLGNVPREAYRLIKHYSTDPQAVDTASEYRVNLLIIDGDHSYSGVKFDYDNYFPLMEPGGFVIFDDYDAKEWPEVKKFVDEEVRQDPHCELIGTFSRTAIVRKKAEPSGS